MNKLNFKQAQQKLGFTINGIKKSDPKATSEGTRKPLKRNCKPIIFRQVHQPEPGISITPNKKLDPKATSESTSKPLKRCLKEITSSTAPPPAAKEQKLDEICRVSYAETSFSSENVDDKEEEEELAEKRKEEEEELAKKRKEKEEELTRKRKKEEELAKKRKEEKEWVTVYGFNPRDADLVLRELRSCGVILKHVRDLDDGNWMHILFKRRSDAQKALGKSWMKINGGLIVGVKPLDPVDKHKVNEDDLNKQDDLDLRLLHRSAAYFFILGSTGNVYTVRLSRKPSCNCPDSAFPCTHILFVYTRVLNLPYRGGDCTASLLTAVINTKATAPETLASARLRNRFHHPFLMSKVGPQVGPPPPMVKLGDDATCSFDGCIVPFMVNGNQTDSEATEDEDADEDNQDWGIVQCGTCRTVGHKECLAFSSTFRGLKVLTCMICEKECWMDRSVLDSYPNLAANLSDDEGDQDVVE
ncbi:hypothetical protein C5167_007549 [Papaver somniferum]|uniref:uncharacterized protein LOC113341515 n=1 Tax=Papaver somniferum TaxID=3469 RepID=UPI000E6F8FBD|nr:uncharacterized protein LOC113341515 [Papaver somniferum]RZC92628.1 hypothetical protein C5167_007549 [Papaver somniferum]